MPCLQISFALSERKKHSFGAATPWEISVRPDSASGAATYVDFDAAAGIVNEKPCLVSSGLWYGLEVTHSDGVTASSRITRFDPPLREGCRWLCWRWSAKTSASGYEGRLLEKLESSIDTLTSVDRA